MKTDVSNEDSVRELVEETVKRYGRLDYAFNNGRLQSIGNDKQLGEALVESSSRYQMSNGPVDPADPKRKGPTLPR